MYKYFTICIYWLRAIIIYIITVITTHLVVENCTAAIAKHISCEQIITHAYNKINTVDEHASNKTEKSQTQSYLGGTMDNRAMVERRLCFSEMC